MDNLKIYYVYVDRRLSNRKVFYVGKGKGSRIKDPWRNNIHWLRTAVKEKGYLREVVEFGLTEQQAIEMEVLLIKRYGRNNLANLTDGGEGQSGAVVSESTRFKMSVAGKGRKKPDSFIRYLKTRVVTDEHREKIREANRRRKGKLSSETKLKMRNAKLGFKHTDEMKKKVSLSLIGNQRAKKYGK